MTRPGPIEAEARQRARNIRSRMYAASPAVKDDGVACPSASRKTPPRFIAIAPRSPDHSTPEPSPEPLSPFQTRLCAGCRKKMRSARNMPIESSGIMPDKRASILQRLGEAEKHSVSDCILAVVVYLDIRRELVLSQLRAKPLVRARQLAMWLCRHETGRSLPEIGRRIGGRDHSTVLHGCRLIDKIVATRSEPDVAEAALELRGLFRQAQPQVEID